MASPEISEQIAAKYPLGAEAGASAVADELSGSIRMVDGVDGATLNSFRAAARDAVAAYLSEHRTEFNTYLESMGVLPIGEGGSDDSEQWLAFRRCFGDARFDPSSAVMIQRTRGGTVLVQAGSGPVRLTERPEARPEWARSPRDSYELRVKGLFRAYAAGSPQFEATLGIEFAHDPRTDHWVLVRTRLYDVPDGVMVVDPPV
ncbi:MAG: hypothetical protein EDM82_08715 [Cyanobacteria bacterium CYA]|nr:MAG: hypothetical protein EDM82_08715 [Cyanobacteria bacterium CYA]